MGSDGFWWVLMEFDGFRWVSMGSDGFRKTWLSRRIPTSTTHLAPISRRSPIPMQNTREVRSQRRPIPAGVSDCTKPSPLWTHSTTRRSRWKPSRRPPLCMASPIFIEIITTNMKRLVYPFDDYYNAGGQAAHQGPSVRQPDVHGSFWRYRTFPWSHMTSLIYFCWKNSWTKGKMRMMGAVILSTCVRENGTHFVARMTSSNRFQCVLITLTRFFPSNSFFSKLF